MFFPPELRWLLCVITGSQRVLGTYYAPEALGEVCILNLTAVQDQTDVHAGDDRAGVWSSDLAELTEPVSGHTHPAAQGCLASKPTFFSILVLHLAGHRLRGVTDGHGSRL